MSFDDLADLFDPDLHLPIRGKVYRVPPPPAAVGLQLQALQAVASAIRNGQAVKASDRARLVLDDDDEMDLLRKALGPVYDEMVADGVPYPYLQHAGTTAYLHWTVGATRSEEHWRSRAGEAPRPLSTTAAGRETTGTGEVSTTKRRASGSGTRSRSKSSPAASARKRPAPGGTSS